MFYGKIFNLALRYNFLTAVSLKFFLSIPSNFSKKIHLQWQSGKCTAIDENIAKHQQLAEKLTEYKKSLIYEVVTGKMDV